MTEVGRQPWIIYGIMKTKDALTPMPGLVYPLLLFAFLYLILAAAVTFLMYRRLTRPLDKVTWEGAKRCSLASSEPSLPSTQASRLASCS